MNNSSTHITTDRDSETQSLWQNIRHFLPVKSTVNIESIYDVLIVGGGITGVTTALLLQKAGKNCILAEANTIGFGSTGGTTAHINTFFDATYPQIESNFSQNAAKQVAQAGKEVIAFIKNLIDTYQIDCDFEFKDAYLFSETDGETKELTKILKASQNAGISITEVEDNCLPIRFQHSLRIKNQAQFHPLKYIFKLAEEFQKLGGKICEHTFVKETDFDEHIHTVQTNHNPIIARNIVYATHIPPGINLLSFRCAPYRSYVIGVKLTDNNYPNCLAYDMKEHYHYFRTQVISGEKYLIIGGEDHKTGHSNPEEAFNNLEAYAKHHFNIQTIPFKWSAQYYTSADGLPYIGKMPSGYKKSYVATGFNGNGITFGTLSAIIISNYILGKPNPYGKLFDPGRLKPIAGFTDFIKENADVAYHFIADRLSIKEINSLKDIKRGEGKIVDFEHQKIAIYKGENGLITALNPVCTHAKCIVNFNNVEKSWDCPCHGGRFDLNGKVITGPPRHNLSIIDISE